MGTTNHVLQHQPRHSPESDLFYDFDIDLDEEEDDDDEPGSPAEESTAAELARLLVNPKILKLNHHDACHCSPSNTKTMSVHQDPESSCLYVSPINGTPPDSDSSEIFFDPESSDTEKQKSEVFFDPVTTSDSEITSNLSNHSVPARAKVTSSNRRTEKNLERVCEDTSESESCSSGRNLATCENHQREELVCSSEDSLNGRSSQETTSLSHESLWSTFDDSTVSLQDESPPRISCPIVPHIGLPKSHSDSELPSNDISTVMPGRLDRQHEENGEEECSVDETDFVDVTTENLSTEKNDPVGDCKELTGVDNICNNLENSVDEETDERQSAESTESKTVMQNCSSQLKTEDATASDTDTDYSTYSSTINIPGALTLECSIDTRVGEEPILKNEVKLQIDNNGVLDDDNKDGKMLLLLTKLSSSPSPKVEEEVVEEEDLSPKQVCQNEIVEEEEEQPQRIRRSSSLKTGKTPPGTPGRKKIVRFADVLGLDLAAVRTFLDEIPRIPNSAYSDLIFQKDDFFQKDSSPVNMAASTGNCWNGGYLDDSRRGSTTLRKVDRMLMPLFQQPGGMANFLDLVRERRVCLENALVQDPVTLAIQGTVRVINLDFHKSVHIRYTLNSWRNFSDLQATYVPNSCDGFSDKFSFILYCHTLPIGQRLEFAVRFQCKGMQYWDNNAGANYCFQCLPSSSSAGYIPITASEGVRHTDWTPMFY